MKPTRSYLSFSVAILSLLNLWPAKQKITNTKWQTFKDASLILSLLPTALPVLGDFCRQLYVGIDNVTFLIDNLIALTCISGMIYMVICFLQKRSLIKNLVKHINKFKAFSDSSIIIETDRKANLYTKVFLLYGTIGNIIYLLMPQLNVEKCRKTRSEAMIHDGVPCGLVVRGILPFKFDYSPVFEIVYVHQIYTCAMVTLITLVLTMLLIGFLMQTIEQLQQMQLQLRKIKHKLSLKRLHNWIRYNLVVIKYSQDLNEAFTDMMLLHLTLTSVVISVLCFQVIMVDNFTDSIRFALHLFGWIILLLLICVYTQQLIDKSMEIAIEIYDCDWFVTKSMRLRKDILMILMRWQRPLHLSAANMGAMSLATFLRVLSSAYSFFTLLLQLKP